MLTTSQTCQHHTCLLNEKSSSLIKFALIHQGELKMSHIMARKAKYEGKIQSF